MRPILMYHSIATVDRDPHQLCVPPWTLARQLRTLAALGLRGVGVGDLLAAQRRGRARGLVGLTFDDGYADTLRAALPLLERFGFTATAFVLSARDGGTNDWDEQPRLPLLSHAGIRELRDRGVEIGSHGRTHRRLTGLPAAELEREVVDSRDELAGILGAPPAGFCYPYGAFDGAAQRAVAAAGYVYGCAVSVADASPYTLRRFFVGPGDGPLRLVAKLALDRVGLHGRDDPAPHAAAVV